MAKSKNWFERLKSFFTSETKSRKEKKEKRKKLRLFGFGQVNSRCPPALPAPSLREAEEVAVPVAAAEAAIAAARVVRPHGPPLSCPRAQELAAIKIETAFRALLARRALRALKGLVKLQALIRGQAVRRRTTAALRGLQSLMKLQSQARASRVRAAEEDWADEEKYMVYVKATGSTLQQHIHRRWNSSSSSKEALLVSLNNRREAATRRERATEYAFSRQERRRPTTSVSKDFATNFRERRWSWLDQRVGGARPLGEDVNIPEIFPSPRRDQKTQARRRSFSQSRRTSLRDEESPLSGSPSLPSYMASTASAKARFRLSSTPKQRAGTVDDASGLLPSPLPSNASCEAAGLGKKIKMLSSPRLKAHGGTGKVP